MPSCDWTEKFSKTHQTTYYYNAKTKATSWTKPADYVAPAPEEKEKKAKGKRPAEKGEQPLAKKDKKSPGAGAAGATEEAKAAGGEGEKLPPKVVTSSYQAPVSGAAVDEQAISSTTNSKALPEPKITADLPKTEESMWTRKDIQVNQFLADTYTNGFIVDKKGVSQKFKDVTNPLQGRNLYNLVRDNKFTRTLEVGFAMGASATWIGQAHKDNGLDGVAHYAIDPNQTAQYEGIGRHLLDKAGVGSCLTVLEMTSYRAMPHLLEEILAGRIPKFHLIYIDGWHTFDYTLVDFFYADLLLETNGVIVLDDIKHKPVHKCFEYIESNYPHYQVVQRTPVFRRGEPSNSSQATFIKRSSDARTWNYHKEF